MIKYINKSVVKNKTILLKVDFNINLNKKGHFKIKAVLPTIDFLIKNGAKKIVLMTHLGRPKGREMKLSTKLIKKQVEEVIGRKVSFLDNYSKKDKIEKSEKGSIFLLENLRFWPEENKNTKSFAKSLASLGDVFVNDAFGVSHRNQASSSAIVNFLPSYGGLLLKEEIKNLDKVRKNFKKPLVLVLGGAKIASKLPLLQKFSKSAQYILLGGGVANSVLESLGWEMGRSLSDPDLAEELIKDPSFQKKVVLPEDFLVAKSLKSKKSEKRYFWDIKEKEMALDIGPEAIKNFKEIISNAKTIIFNGPLGYTPNPIFEKSTKEIAKAISKSSAFSVVGGGDTVNVLSSFKMVKKFGFVSTGGGAMLEYLAGKDLPALKSLGLSKNKKM